MSQFANPFHPKKLLLHQGKVAALARREMIAPQTIEVDLTDGACNQGCVYCCFSSGEGKNMAKIDSARVDEFISEHYEMLNEYMPGLLREMCKVEL